MFTENLAVSGPNQRLKVALRGTVFKPVAAGRVFIANLVAGNSLILRAGLIFKKGN
jgi:hypothetical protein